MIKNYFPSAVVGTMTTSLLFLTNTIHLSYKQDVIYCYTFLCLSILSLLYHLSKNNTIGILDKICIAGVTLQGGKTIFLDTEFDKYSVVVITTFAGVIWIYHYGYITNRYAFDNNIDIGNRYHMIIHILSSVGHHAVACKIQSIQ
jgi:hypothetical protein